MTDDIEWIKSELLASQKLNQELHRRLQLVEGADTRINSLRASMQGEIDRWIEIEQTAADYHRSQLREVCRKLDIADSKLDNLPFWAKWMIK